MDKGISFFFGYKLNNVVTAKMIKDSGLNCVMTNADKRFKHENGTIKQQITLFKKNGLKISSLHMQYLTKDLPHFFMNDKIGKHIEKTLKKDLKIAKKYGFKCVVVHMYGKVNQIGIDRFKRILKVAEKVKIPLALENINDGPTLCYFMDNFKSPYVKFCYDVGHNHCFDPEIDYLKIYGDRLVCLHLHDNKGDGDSHTLNKFGTIDWDNVAKQLASCPDVSLDYELLFYEKCNYSAKEVLDICYKQACELETKINNYKQEVINKPNKTPKRTSNKNLKQTSGLKTQITKTANRKKSV